MKIDATTISSLTAAMRARGVRELEIAEGEMSVRIALPDVSAPAGHLPPPPPPGAKAETLVVRSTAAGRFLSRHPGRTTDFVPGDTVSADQVVGVVAIGSLLRPVVALVDGTIVQRFRQSGDFVDYGTPLLELKSLSQPAR